MRIWIQEAYQCPHRPVKRMPVVPSEFGICAFERGVAVRLGLLDAVFARDECLSAF